MVVDRADGQVQPPGHLGVGQPVHDQPEDLGLAGAQHVLGDFPGGVRLGRSGEGLFEGHRPALGPRPRELFLAHTGADGG